MTDSVLIVHHRADIAGKTSSSAAFQLSNAAVMDEVRAVAGALKELAITYNIAAIGRIDELADVLRDHPAAIVFNLVEELSGGPFAACYVPQLCEAMGKTCTGADTGNLTLTLDKWQTKLALQRAGLPCPQGVLVPQGVTMTVADFITPPYIVKPVHADASEGIDAASIVYEADDKLTAQIHKVHDQFRQPALVEQYIDGREINVALRQHDAHVEVMPLAEIDFSAFTAGQPRIVDYAAKWVDSSFAYHHTPRKIPAPLPEHTASAIRHYALRCWHVLGCRDYARVDFRLDPSGRAYILEVNSNPDISPDAGFAAALAAGRVRFADFVRDVLGQAQARSGTACLAMPPADGGEVEIRYAEAGDRTAVLAMLQTANVFRSTEIDVAMEVYDDALIAGTHGHYQSFVLAMQGDLSGWICFGPIDGTVGGYDIYWLVVRPEMQGRGLGAKLVSFALDRIELAGGRQAVIETSGSPNYESARQFYLRRGFTLAGQIGDFYGPGDDKCIYTKQIETARGAEVIEHLPERQVDGDRMATKAGDASGL